MDFFKTQNLTGILFLLILTLFSGKYLWAQGPETQSTSFNGTWVGGSRPTLEEKKKITIAIVQDGSSAYFEKLIDEIQAEFNKIMGLMGEGKEIIFKRKGFNAHWNPKAITSILGKALIDEEVDIVLAVGVLSAQGAASPLLYLPKPVVATMIDRSELLAMPISEAGKSTKENFTFVVLNLPISRDFKEFHDMIDFKTVYVLIDRIYAGHLKGVGEAKKKIENQLGININFIRGGDKAEDYLKQLSPDMEAVVLAGSARMPEEEIQKLINGINQLRIPSFSLVGYSEVKRGVLGGMVPETFMRTARRAALDLQQVILGFRADDLSVMMPIQARLLINGKTARLVGYSPSYVTLQTANFIIDKAFEEGEALNLQQAMRKAGQQNTQNLVSIADTRISKQTSLINRSALLPQAGGSINYFQVDQDRALASNGSLPQRQTSGDLNFSQVIFDDQLLSNFRASRKDYFGSKFNQESTRLDSILTGGRSYVRLLAAIALLKIEAQNLSLTQDNLEIAQLRFEVGMAGQDEVYRWEAQEAQQRGAVFQRIAEVDNAMVALNQVMNMPMDKIWNAIDIPPDQAMDYFFEGRIGKMVANVKQNRLMQDFLVEKSLENSPELKSFVKQVEGQGIRLNQKKRSFFLPSLGAQFNYSRQIQRSFAGPPAAGATDRDEWTFQGSASLPIFQGGFRVHDMNQAKAGLMRLQAQRTLALQQVEQDTRNQMNDISSSRPNIFFTRRAADKAKLNLDIVKQKYAEGTVGILDLLDAQNEYITREQEAAIAVYAYISDVIDVQRAISYFDIDHTPQENEMFLQEAQEYLKNEGRTQPIVLEKDLTQTP